MPVSGIGARRLTALNQETLLFTPAVPEAGALRAVDGGHLALNPVPC